jgi:hypothetical protein
MRKRIINEGAEGVSTADKNWLDLEGLAQEEVSSEDAAHPIESALIPNTGSGWRAAQAGKQTVRLQFDKPQKIRSIRLVFQENEQGRTHEFVLRWSPDSGQSYPEIARQQFNFSPPGTTRELEDYTVELHGLTTLELIIVPDISGGSAHASGICLTLEQRPNNKEVPIDPLSVQFRDDPCCLGPIGHSYKGITAGEARNAVFHYINVLDSSIRCDDCSQFAIGHSRTHIAHK